MNTTTRITVPDGFLWGAATSGHQVEGNNTTSDIWELENAPSSPLAERSGDACDSYHRWPEDLDIVAELGLNSYRFSIEWCRVEPVRGHVSRAALAHYRRMIEGCWSRGLTPVVTLHHFTSPAWFRAAGGWLAPDGVERFRDYVRAVLPILDGVRWVCTINEPNMLALVSTILAGRHDPELPVIAAEPDGELVEALIAAHRAAREVLADSPGIRSGWTVANQNFQRVHGADSDTEHTGTAWRDAREGRFLDVSAEDDFVGVQAYTRTLVDERGPVDPPDGARRTLTGWEFYPAALEEAVRCTARRVGDDVALLVTENGIATDDDAQRTEYLRGALDGLARTLADGIDVRGYLHWSLLDNYEWGSWRPTFGLAAVDHETFTRTIKPSARVYAEMVRTGRA